MMKINTNLLNIVRYTLYAPGYDLVARLLDASRKRSIDQLNIKAGDKVLIIGAGTGIDLDFLPLGCHITATDITPAMVRRIEIRNKKMKHQLTTMVMDGQQLNFSSQSFDIVILHLILAVIPDPVKCIKEAERVLKTGGKIAVYDKFLAPNRKPSAFRKFFNLFTNLFFSNITRSFEVLLAEINLQVTTDEKADLQGMFRIIQLKK